MISSRISWRRILRLFWMLILLDISCFSLFLFLFVSIVMSTEGILWMGIIADKFLWTATPRELSIWNIDQTVHFYALARSKVTSIQVAQSDRKTSRVVAVGDDSR